MSSHWSDDGVKARSNLKFFLSPCPVRTTISGSPLRSLSNSTTDFAPFPTSARDIGRQRQKTRMLPEPQKYILLSLTHNPHDHPFCTPCLLHTPCLLPLAFLYPFVHFIRQTDRRSVGDLRSIIKHLTPCWILNNAVCIRGQLKGATLSRAERRHSVCFKSNVTEAIRASVSVIYRCVTSSFFCHVYYTHNCLFTS